DKHRWDPRMDEGLSACLCCMEHNDPGNTPCLQAPDVVLWGLTVWVRRYKQIVAQRNCLTLNVFIEAQVEILRRSPQVRQGQNAIFGKEVNSNHTGALANQALGNNIGFVAKSGDCSIYTLWRFII